MEKKRLMRDTVFLTSSSLIMRGIALVFQMWLVSRIGAAGVGLYGLVSSVSFLAATVAISGIRFATTRLVSEELGLKRIGGVGRAIRLCTAYSLFFGLAAFAILWLCAEPIGFLCVGDARTVLSLKVLSFQMPFISLSSVLYGYFAATRRIFKAAGVQMTEQLARIALVVVFLSRVPEGDIEKSCAAVSLGGTAAEVLAFGLMLSAFFSDRRRHRAKPSVSPRLPARMLNIAVPLALSAYARTSLTTLEQILVPRGLKKAGFSANAALAGYGTIQGMVFPVIFFPSCLMTSLAELIVPELTAAQVSGRKEEIRRAVSSLLKKCLLYSLFVGLMLYLLADVIGGVIYKSEEAGRYIAVFSLLVPVMYMDMVVDGCLKGLGQQVCSMGINIMDALLGVVLVYLLLPRYALTAYIAIIFFEEIFNFILSVTRLIKVTDIREARF